ncbi:RNA-binding domain-containing protein [Pholiota conissans]|uniref:Probable RNA-binding protein 18 n=1 Tax=Pholiota conissans TaxID=109636 RepID=A0A9P5YLN7_9AGAR|nr:RNA-binding domain-containing protein [Pholiota conissans]
MPALSEQQRPLLKDRLYVGNLHPSVDEYTLLQVFSKFGKITKLDWLFHKTGLLKAKPRGYAFVEYANQDDALRALSGAHGKSLRGRNLVVTFAHQAPLDQYSGGTGASVGAYRTRKTMMDIGRPTTLSMIKTGMSGRHEGYVHHFNVFFLCLRWMKLLLWSWSLTFSLLSLSGKPFQHPTNILLHLIEKHKTKSQ